MTPSLKSSPIHFMLSTGICVLLLGSAAWSEEAPEKARALLDQVTKSEQDRQIAAKQKEIERLQEDQAKTERDSSSLKETMESTSGLIDETSAHLATLTADSRRLQHELAVSEAWTNAETLKIAGLRALTEAQGKSLAAATRRAEEADARSHLMTVEMEILQAGKQVPGELREGSQGDLAKASKAVAVAESKADSEERLAHEAMKAAAAKMAVAEAKAATARRLADNDLTLEPTVVTKAKAKPPVKPTEKLAPIAAPPKPAANAATTAKPTPNTGAAKPNKAPALR
ncbi:MAG: hypothetical protein ABJF10_10810 [Chthoniobacter sp.]|uniref:hypothetical protein n=1 Tax=Chthoniobacter sp. TaxID=2510640 RepID=UPI0032AE3FB7